MSVFNLNTSIVVSITENRAREICICSMELSNLSMMHVFIIIDNHSYTESLNILESLNPNEILIHDGCRDKILTNKIQSKYNNQREFTSVLYISRQFFDQNRGADLLKKVISGNVDNELISKYTVLAGSYCLLRYIENCQNIAFTRNCLRLEFNGSTNSKPILQIDRHTLSNLELISNARSGSQQTSLFGVLNHTKTTVGSRLLRASLHRPSAHIETINGRLDSIKILLKSQRATKDIRSLLDRFPDLDVMLTGLNTRPKTLTDKTARIGIDTLIYLKETVNLVTAASGELVRLVSESNQNSIINNNSNSNSNNGDGDGSGSSGSGGNSGSSSTSILLQAICDAFQQPCLQTNVLSTLQDHLTDSTCYSKSQIEMRHQECFALKRGRNALLDVARTTFQSSVEDIYHLADQYSLALECPVKVVHSASRGYYLNISSTIQDTLPSDFIQCVLNKKTISCTTEELASLSDRASESISTALFHTHELIQVILEQIRTHMNSLFVVVDAVALLDMLCSHTTFCSICFQQGFPLSHPVVTIDDTKSLVIKEGRHIIVESLQKLDYQFVPNDTCITIENNMQIVTGPNGSGKSTLIKQVAIIVVLAQIGCFVPASSAIIPIRHRILSRIGTADDPEHNLSSFLVEMREAAYILDHVDEKSLVIIDELGRGTSTVDGCSLAFAVAEELLQSKCFCLFVTHFPEITALQELYFPQVRNKHLQITLQNNVGNTSRDNSASFLYRVGEGSSIVRGGYGIRMAELCGFPQDILRIAWDMQARARQVLPRFILPTVDRTNDVIRVLLRRLIFLTATTSLNHAGVSAYVDNIRQKLSPSLIQTVTEFCLQELNSSQSNTSQENVARDTDIVHSMLPITVDTKTGAEVDHSNQLQRMLSTLSTSSIMTTEQIQHENITSNIATTYAASTTLATSAISSSRKVERTQSLSLSEVQFASPFKKKVIKGANTLVTTMNNVASPSTNVNINNDSKHKLEHEDDQERKKPSVIYINSSSTSTAISNAQENNTTTNVNESSNLNVNAVNDGCEKSLASYSLSSLSTHNTAITLSQTESQSQSQDV